MEKLTKNIDFDLLTLTVFSGKVLYIMFSVLEVNGRSLFYFEYNSNMIKIGGLFIWKKLIFNK